MNNTFKKVILIGYGAHTQNKIIPAIKNVKIKIIAIVTKKKISYKGAVILKNIEDITLFKTDKSKTIVLISSPPILHFTQINFLLKNNFNIICEKPIFLNTKQLNLSIKKIHKNIIVENLMYFYTKNYKKLESFWKKNINTVSEINIDFLIPELPNDTFRNNYQVEHSYIYDIGCYPMTLLGFLGFNLRKLKLINSKSIFAKKKQFSTFTYMINNTLIKFRIGIDTKYSNKVIFKCNNNKTFVFDLIFYGIQKYKTNLQLKNNEFFKSYKFKDHNGFENILKKPVRYWRDNQKDRLNKIKEVTFALHKLSKIYKKKLNDKFR